ncbi:hypothetical protein S7711_04513 [Stachybotrys chartarum IBT 7711]|uniref:LysM domain-containing protein n=1 Tax=Stachybotrys chartarum (strain CBS 109288 / IBT 7711) TaxID=1280523 RepID=A0A084BAA0_STACB|nr:hypothetical protein S7711_04513 [Stachybotrys chartarum IBT 7711]
MSRLFFILSLLVAASVTVAASVVAVLGTARLTLARPLIVPDSTLLTMTPTLATTFLCTGNFHIVESGGQHRLHRLWTETYYCVGVTGTPTTRPTTTISTRITTVTTTTSQGNGITTPTTTHPQIASKCNSFLFMRPGESCQVIAARNDISQAQFIACNPSAGSSCIGLWANANACVRTVGFVPPGVMNCYTTGNTWGDNQPAALAGVVEWCKGNSNSDGNGAYATAQTKYGCSNAQYGQNKLEFWIRNNFGVDMSLSVAR